jgi:hypothetical protein
MHDGEEVHVATPGKLAPDESGGIRGQGAALLK